MRIEDILPSDWSTVVYWASERTGMLLDEAQIGLANTADRLEAAGKSALAPIGYDHLFAPRGPVAGEHLLLVLAAFFVLAAVAFRRRGRLGDPSAELADDVRRPRFVGRVTALLFVGGFAAWSLLAPLSSAAMAIGVVSPDGNRKTVSHLEGGIIRTIHVTEGEKVEKGQVLVSLQDVQAKARHEELLARYSFLLATRARLEAERNLTPDITPPAEFADLAEADTRRLMETQKAVLHSRLAAMEGRKRILNQRVLQLIEQKAGFTAVTGSQDGQIALIAAELNNTQTLFESGLSTSAKLLDLRRLLADLTAERALNAARILELDQKIGETELELISIDEQFQEDTANGLAEVERSLSEIGNELRATADVLTRTVVQAPISGVIHDLRVQTETGVIESGAPILDIVPRDAKLIIDARVRPTDIDRVRPEMDARVILSAYKQRGLPLIYGKLLTVSADAMLEQKTGEAYYLAKVEVDGETLASHQNIELVPGMPAEVMLLDQERSLFDYLFSPLLSSFDRSLRED